MNYGFEFAIAASIFSTRMGMGIQHRHNCIFHILLKIEKRLSWALACASHEREYVWYLTSSEGSRWKPSKNFYIAERKLHGRQGGETWKESSIKAYVDVSVTNPISPPSPFLVVFLSILHLHSSPPYNVFSNSKKIVLAEQVATLIMSKVS